MYFKIKKFSDEEVENFAYDEIWRVLVVKTAKIFVVEALNVHVIFLDKIAGNLVFSINGALFLDPERQSKGSYTITFFVSC